MNPFLKRIFILITFTMAKIKILFKTSKLGGMCMAHFE